jgi:hypothetical protein
MNRNEGHPPAWILERHRKTVAAIELIEGESLLRDG